MSNFNNYDYAVLAGIGSAFFCGYYLSYNIYCKLLKKYLEDKKEYDALFAEVEELKLRRNLLAKKELNAYHHELCNRYQEDLRTDYENSLLFKYNNNLSAWEIKGYYDPDEVRVNQYREVFVIRRDLLYNKPIRKEALLPDFEPRLFDFSSLDNADEFLLGSMCFSTSVIVLSACWSLKDYIALNLSLWFSGW